MQQFDWRSFEPVDFRSLGLAREQFHQAVQYISAVGRKFLPKSENDENATLIWVPGLSRLAGKWVDGDKTFRCSIGLGDFTIYLVDQKVNTIASLSIDGKTQSQVLIWLEEQIGKLGLDASDLTMNLPYSIPDYKTQRGEPFSLDLKLANEFAKYYHNNFISVRDIAIKHGIKNAEIKTWPHHFDHAWSMVIKETGDEDTNSTILIGMSPGDEEFDQPYFYVNSWPHCITSQFEPLTNGARWHEEHWTGAVLLAENFIPSKNQKMVIQHFFESATNKLVEVLLA